jgi:hypothetical protein
VGVYGLFGALLVWNGLLWRKEAKEDLTEIKASKESAVLLLAETNESNEKS